MTGILSFRRSLHSGLSVAENYRNLRFYAFLEMRMMEIQAAWLASTAQIELKDELGQFIYEDAEHANILLARSNELVSIIERSAHERETDRVQALCNEIGNATELGERWAGLYGILKPEMIRLYRDHLARTDQVCDAPSVRILKQIVQEEEEQVSRAEAVLRDLDHVPNDSKRVSAWYEHLRKCMNQVGGLCDAPNASGLNLGLFRNPAPPLRFLDTFPARDDRWQFIPLGDPLPSAPGNLDPIDATELMLATLANGEYEAAELLARTLVDFPDAPWDLRFRIARQLWDEVRHGEMQVRRLTELGKGLRRVPVKRFTYSKAGFERDLGRRLMVLNRVTEGRALDLNLKRFAFLIEKANDPKTARFFDYILADETQHIDNSNWIHTLNQGDLAQEAEIVQFGEDIRRELEEFIGGRVDTRAIGVRPISDGAG